jgi:hypothetical protein
MTDITSSFIQSGPWTNFIPGLILLVALFRPDHEPITHKAYITSSIIPSGPRTNFTQDLFYE